MQDRVIEWIGEGIRIYDETQPRPDLVLMDLHLPYQDGYEALAKLRSDPRFAETRVVAVTADANPTTMEKVKKAGFDGFLGKPIDPDKFPNQIIEILQGENVWDLGY